MGTQGNCGWLDLEGLRNVHPDSQGLDAFFVTIGGGMYSEFFDDSNRRWLNPYPGFRGGYARFLGKNEILAGGALGVEMYKSSIATVDLESPPYAIFGTDAGVHMGVQPRLGVNVAF